MFFAARGLSGLSPADGWRAGPGTPGAAPGYPIGISVAAISMAAINKYLARRNRSRMRAEATKQRDAIGKVHERQQEPLYSHCRADLPFHKRGDGTCMKQLNSMNGFRNTLE